MIVKIKNSKWRIRFVKAGTIFGHTCMCEGSLAGMRNLVFHMFAKVETFLWQIGWKVCQIGTLFLERGLFRGSLTGTSKLLFSYLITPLLPELIALLIFLFSWKHGEIWSQPSNSTQCKKQPAELTQKNNCEIQLSKQRAIQLSKQRASKLWTNLPNISNHDEMKTERHTQGICKILFKLQDDLTETVINDGWMASPSPDTLCKLSLKIPHMAWVNENMKIFKACLQNYCVFNE